MSHFNGFLILTLCYASSSSYAATETGPYLKTIRADGSYKSKSNSFNDNEAGMNALIDELKMLRNQADDESTRVEKNLQSYKKETSPNKLNLDGKQHRYEDKIMPHLDYLMMRLEGEAPQKLANLDRRYENDGDGYDKRNFDPIDRSGFSTFVKKAYLDPIDRSGFATYVKKNIDPIDRSGFGSFVKKNLDPFDISGFGTYIKRNFDTFDRSGFSTFNKKAFDPIDASGFRGYVKKSPFDTIDRSGFSDFVKKNIDPIDRSGFSTFTKKNIDPIDRSGFSSFTKKNIDPIDRSGFSSFTKKNIDPIDRSGFGNFVKRSNRNHYDTIDAASFAKQAAPSSTKQMSEIIY